jgi:hypothetical protein
MLKTRMAREEDAYVFSVVDLKSTATLVGPSRKGLARQIRSQALPSPEQA